MKETAIVIKASVMTQQKHEVIRTGRRLNFAITNGLGKLNTKNDMPIPKLAHLASTVLIPEASNSGTA